MALFLHGWASTAAATPSLSGNTKKDHIPVAPAPRRPSSALRTAPSARPRSSRPQTMLQRSRLWPSIPTATPLQSGRNGPPELRPFRTPRSTLRLARTEIADRLLLRLLGWVLGLWTGPGV